MLRTVSLGVHVYPLAELKRTDREGEAFLRDAFARIDVVLARAGLAHVEPEEGRARWPSTATRDRSWSRPHEAGHRRVRGHAMLRG